MEFRPSKDGGTFRIKRLVTGKTIELDVLSIGEQPPYHCDDPLPEQTRSVIVLSVKGP